MENENNIGFIGSEGTNLYSNPYQSDLYSKPSIKREANKIAEENKRASKAFLDNPPEISEKQPNTIIPIAPQNITDLSALTEGISQTITPTAPSFDNIEPSNTNNSGNDQQPAPKKSEKIKKSNKMDYNENKTSEAYLLNEHDGTKVQINNDEDVDEKTLRPPRKNTVCCLCCPLWVCIGITIGIIVFIGVMALIFWPKIPDVNISSIALSEPTNGEPSIRYQVPTTDNDEKGGLEMDLDIFVTVKNDNFYNLHVHSINTRVYVQTSNLEKTLVGKGEKKNLSFEKHNTTEFVLPVTIGYYVDDIMKSNALLYLLKACSSNDAIKIQYEVDIGLFAIFESIYKPTYSGSESFYCPENGVNPGDISSILMGDIYTSLSEYFSNFVV